MSVLPRRAVAGISLWSTRSPRRSRVTAAMKGVRVEAGARKRTARAMATTRPYIETSNRSLCAELSAGGGVSYGVEFRML
jgi:hypothetical protein